MSYLRIWGSHLRWTALCENAWEIVFSGRIPATTQPPPIVEEYKGTVHNKMVRIAAEWFAKSQNTIQMMREEPIEYSVHPSWSETPVVLVLKPDIFVLWNSPVGPVNLVVEVTTRRSSHIPEEWLTACMLGLYIRNLRPTFTLLVTPEEAKILLLTTRGVENLGKLIEKGSRRKPTPSLCYNCDLRQICPSPLV